MIQSVSICCPTKSQGTGCGQTSFGNVAEKLVPRVPMEIVRKGPEKTIKYLTEELFKPLAVPLKKDFKSTWAYNTAIRNYYIELSERSGFLNKFRDKNGYIDYEKAIAASKGKSQQLYVVV